MKLENLERAKDLLAMKKTALAYLKINLEALEHIEKYTYDCCLYHDIDMTMQANNSYTPTTKFVQKTVVLKSYTSVGHDTVAIIPFDIFAKAIKEEIKRLNDRIVEIEKEVETL